MAIDELGGHIDKFARSYKKTFFAVAFVIQMALLLLAAVTLASLFGAGIVDTQPLIVFSAIAFVGSFSVWILLAKITEPLNKLLDALLYKTGKLGVKPPSPNTASMKRSGLGGILRHIYKVPEGEFEIGNVDDIETAKLVMKSLDLSSSGIVIMNPNKEIIYANKSAPVTKNRDGKLALALDFLNEKTVDEWLSEIESKEIHAENVWQRIPTDPSLLKNQRFFDVAASYQKSASTETVLVMIDRSDAYSPEEEDLNFIAFAAHELRGPITVIRGYLDILNEELEGRLKGDEPKLFDRLMVSSNRLSGYVNNILNVSRYDRHHLKISLAEETIKSTYESVARDMESRAAAQHRVLNVEIPDDLPTVAIDKVSIGEVIMNLIDNAIKYSFEGGVITVSAAVKGDFVELSVKDNGIGMPSSVIKDLFRKFYRSHRSRDTVAGTGIGLYISKAFVESHGGNITVKSQENEGSTFSFTVPIYETVKDKLLEDGSLNSHLIRQGTGWIKNHNMYRN